MIMIEFGQLFIILFFKFVTLAVLPYYIFWKWFPEKFHKIKIQKVERQKPQVQFELKNSMIVVLIQTFFFWTLFKGNQVGVFKIFTEFGSQGVLTEVAAFGAYFIIYDTYFYWTHRFLHWGWFYKNVHVVHHRSLNPTPLAIYSFHPIEAVLGLLYFYPVLMLFPMSLTTFLVLIVLTDLGNLAGHLGYEILPRGLVNSVFGSWITTPTHHNMHHQFSKYNFGLYWNGWDKLFGTQHENTAEEFNKVRS